MKESIMKRFVAVFILVQLVVTACEDRTFQTYMANVPVYLSYEELRNSFEVSGSRDLAAPGKICFKDHFMYINEYRKGIHILDLSDPQHPEQVSYIKVPGNVDLAIRDNTLYADSYTDLVLIDISDPADPQEFGRTEDLFEYVIPSYDIDYPLYEIDEEKGVVVAFEVKEVTREVHQNPYPWPVYYLYDEAFAYRSAVPATGAADGGSTYGVGGSMARFITFDEYLYVLESSSLLKSILITDPGSPEIMNEQYLSGNIETVFISQGYLYVGSSAGMHILDLSEPSAPNKLSTYRHITACDPVVVDGNMAYVTLRAGNLCGGNQNLLEVIDVSNKNNPYRRSSFAMTEPYGLGVDGPTLFVCEGEHGLKIFDTTDPETITAHRIAEFTGMHAYDVIPYDSLLFLIGEDGFQIYDYSNLQSVALLGSIPVVPSGE